MKWTWLLVACALACSACGGDASGPDVEPEDPDTVASPAMEARALWLSRFDWSNESELRALIDSAAGANFNIIYFQARARSDAYYQSSLEPWAHRPPAFNLGQHPGWDPLGVAVQTARARGLQVHVWLNALIGWCTSESIPETTPRHILLQHPDWVMKDQNGATSADNCNFLSPAEPGVRTHLARVSADIARNYQVDGIHLDYIRYPYPTWGHEAQAQVGYAAAKQVEPSLTFDDYRRRMVTMAVREVRDSLRRANPRAVLSAAVWGVYRNTRGWSGIATGFEGRFQDSRYWLQDGALDVIAPMIYWPIKPTYGDRLDFAWLADDFAKSTFSRHVYIGMGAPLPEEDFCAGCDVVKQIYQARRAGGQGVVVYNARILRQKQLWADIRSGPFKKKVPIPAMAWL